MASTTNTAMPHLRAATKKPAAASVSRVRKGPPPSEVKSIMAFFNQKAERLTRVGGIAQAGDQPPVEC